MPYIAFMFLAVFVVQQYASIHCSSMLLPTHLHPMHCACPTIISPMLPKHALGGDQANLQQLFVATLSQIPTYS